MEPPTTQQIVDALEAIADTIASEELSYADAQLLREAAKQLHARAIAAVFASRMDEMCSTQGERAAYTSAAATMILAFGSRSLPGEAAKALCDSEEAYR